MKGGKRDQMVNNGQDVAAVKRKKEPPKSVGRILCLVRI